MKKILSFYLILFLCTFISTVFAQKSSPFYDLGEVVVTDQVNSAESVATVHTVTAMDIEKRGVRTLNEALKLIPGVYVRQAAANIPRIDIRGLRTRHVLLLLNGIPIKDTYDGQFDPTTIPVDNIARIKVTTGGGSVLYGANGSAGIINIITKTGDKIPHVTLLNELGENGYYSTNATVTGGTDKADAVVSLGSTTLDDVELSGDFDNTSMQADDTRENSDFERQTAFVGLNYAATDALNLGITFNYQDGENGTPPSTINNKKDLFASSVKYDRTEEVETQSLQAAFDYTFSVPLQLRGWVFASQGDTTSKRYDDDTYTTISKKGGYDEDATSKVNGVNLQLAWLPRASDRITLAALYERDSWESNGYEIDKKGKEQAFDIDTDLDFASLALEYSTRITEQLKAVVGFGYHAMDKDTGNDEDDFSCMAGLSYDLIPGTTIKGSWSRSIKFPSTKQLYSLDAGNPDLTPETIHNWELGISQELPAATTVSVTGYIKDAEDFIEKDVDDIYRNYEDYHFKGVEFEVVNTFVENLTLTGSAAFMTSKDKSDNTEKDELQNRPEQKFSVEGTYQFPFGLTAQASFLHVADQYYYSKKSPLEKAKLDDFQIIDCKVSQTLFEDALEVYLRAANLLDEDYEQSYGYPAQGRTFYVGAVLRF
ncbi:Outer membrane cobalamin receptor protein [Desulfocicer vacuolatum DSM 3385]|uniref:Outer membrane cobalamin receptor protein n=1 Tax=Desulfocicer vacuolatum DSM 3385 TaxID=1121400 RepID=A0A1W2ADW7_9BACT|nr:TonB-dependent receptor [Desulfocicer vacuolatum]SMC58866.1 Outer membrane cobalamin receptor protein [Desulfocicer vacuolatum DSM 3385]